MKHPLDKAERLYINAKKDKRKKRKANAGFASKEETADDTENDRG